MADDKHNWYYCERYKMERCAGHTKEAAWRIREKDVLLECYLLGAHHAIMLLLNHGDSVDDHDRFLNRLTAEWRTENGEPLEVWDE